MAQITGHGDSRMRELAGRNEYPLYLSESTNIFVNIENVFVSKLVTPQDLVAQMRGHWGTGRLMGSSHQKRAKVR